MLLSAKVVDPPPKLLFRAVSGPVVYTAISVSNALRRFSHRFLWVSPNWTAPDRQYHIHTGKETEIVGFRDDVREPFPRVSSAAVCAQSHRRALLQLQRKHREGLDHGVCRGASTLAAVNKLHRARE